MLAWTPDTVRVYDADGNYTEIKGHIYPLRAEEAFYDTQETVQNPNEMLTEPEYRDILAVSAEIRHVHNEFIGDIDPPVLYHVAAVPRRWITGGPVAGTECTQVLLSENRSAA